MFSQLTVFLFFSLALGNPSFSQGTEQVPAKPSKPFLKYQVPEGDWVLNILRRLKQLPLYGPDGSLAKTVALNPKTLDRKGNLVGKNSVVILPITEIPAGAPYIHGAGLFILRVREPDVEMLAIDDTPKEPPLVEKKPTPEKGVQVKTDFRWVDRLSFGFILGISGGPGDVGDGNRTVQNRSVTGADGFAFPGLKYRFPKWDLLVGPLMDLRFIFQTKTPEDNSDVSGMAYNLGLAAAVYKKPWFGIANYISWGRYNFNQRTSVGNFNYYRQPIGFRFTLGYFLTRYFSVSGTYSELGFTKNKQGDLNETDLHNRLAFSTTAIGLEFHY